MSFASFQSTKTDTDSAASHESSGYKATPSFVYIILRHYSRKADHPKSDLYLTSHTGYSVEMLVPTGDLVLFQKLTNARVKLAFLTEAIVNVVLTKPSLSLLLLKFLFWRPIRPFALLAGRFVDSHLTKPEHKATAWYYSKIGYLRLRIRV